MESEEFHPTAWQRVKCQHCSKAVYECLLDDHIENICPDARVPCLNHQYGCDLRIVRRLMSRHLPVCKASTVFCQKCASKSWTWEEQENSPDYPLIFRRDEIAKHIEDVHLSAAALGRATRTCPWIEEEEDSPRCQQSGAKRFMVPFNTDWTVVTAEDDIQLVVPRCNVAGSDSDMSAHEAVANEDLPAEGENSVEFSVADDGHGRSLHRGLSKEDELSFYGYQKEDIVDSTGDGYMSVPRQLSQTEELALYGYGDSVAEIPAAGMESPHHSFHGCLLLDLPYEVCFLLLNYLDAYSLRQVALTCAYLRDCCYDLLDTRGVVTMTWYKTADGWKSRKHSFFSTVSTYVGSRNWKMVGDHWDLLNHSQKHYTQARKELVAKWKLGPLVPCNQLFPPFGAR